MGKRLQAKIRAVDNDEFNSVSRFRYCSRRNIFNPSCNPNDPECNIIRYATESWDDSLRCRTPSVYYSCDMGCRYLETFGSHQEYEEAKLMEGLRVAWGGETLPKITTHNSGGNNDIETV